MRRLIMLVAAMVAASVSAHAQESKYYELPKGDYPHDVAAGPNGEVWYAGQNLGIAGRLNPTTGEIQRISPRQEVCSAWRDRRTRWRSVVH